ncbi:MAG: hypothetical protein ABI430_01760 [Candidatus Taylorbacteria bacterium]
MAKNILQDVLPPEKRSIRDIPLPSDRRKRISDIPLEVDLPRRSPYNQEQYEPPSPHTFEEKRVSEFVEPPRRRHSRLFLWLSILVALLILGFSFFTVFGSATVEVTPKKVEASLDSNFKAVKVKTDTSLFYDVITLTKTGSKVIEAKEEKQVDSKASGKIIISSNESKPQTLVKNTRFETSGGLIYRIAEPITVPAKKGETPGSIEVTVFADAIGAKYNIAITYFTIPGFKGDPRFKTIVARSKTAMTQGSSGLSKIAAEADLTQAKKDIHTELQKELFQEAQSEMPENFILFDNAVSIEFESLPNDPVAPNSIRVNEQAHFQGIIFNKTALEKSIAKEVIPDFDGKAIEIPNIQALVFSSLSPDNLIEKDEIVFNLKGNPSIVWSYEELELRKMISGKSLDEIEEILKTQFSFDKTEITLKPFWVKKLPRELDKIKIVESKG